MITLYTFGPALGLPDPSPFVTKAEVLLKLAGVPYERKRADVRKAPKGKLPFIRDEDGTIVADSTLIRLHLERTRGLDFDRGLTPAERGIAWAFEKLLEDQLYWVAMRERWLDDANFDRGPRHFFNGLPAPMRSLVIAMVRREVRRNLWGQGIGRLAPEEIEAVAARAVQGLSDFLADKPFMFGDEPRGVDATVWSFTTGMLCPVFTSALRRIGERHANLVAYRDRGMALWFPELSKA
ncbi:MAG: glutathione S-transferase family protein [Hyphomicrobiaceae bacterium]